MQLLTRFPILLRRIARSGFGVYGLLVLASLAYCPMLFTGLDQWGRGDWDQFTFRYETPRRALLVDGQLPMWNPYVNGGNVLLGHPHCPALSPWYLPTLLFGAPLGLRLQVVLMMAIGAVGMAALLRAWGVSSAGCLLGGILLMMSAHFALHVTEGHLEWCVLGLMPWVMFCLVKADRDWRLALVAGLILASAVMHGSIYIVAMFAPLLGVWTVLEGVRRRSWRPPVNWVAAMASALLLSAVVLLPRFEFVRDNPRPTPLAERLSPAVAGSMLLGLDQGALFRSTRDLRNPPEEELARILPTVASAPWYRLEISLATTSDWTDVQFEGFPYVLLVGDVEPVPKLPGELAITPASKEGLALKGPATVEAEDGGGPERRKTTLTATLYAQLPPSGGLTFAVTRGNDGYTELTVRQHGQILLKSKHSARVNDDGANRLVLTLPRNQLLQSADPSRYSSEAWYQVEATVRTTSQWCNVWLPDVPYLFRVEEPGRQDPADVRFSATALATGELPAEKKEASVRGFLFFQCPADRDLRHKSYYTANSDLRKYIFVIFYR